jgi:hypothetical protein
VEKINFLNDPNLDRELFESTFNETFVVELSDGNVVELIPDGKEKKVEYEDRRKYADLLLKARLSEMDKQIDKVKEGICKIVPGSILKCKF